MALDVFAVRFKAREEVLIVALANVGHGFSVGLDDFEILVIHPDPSLKIALILLNFLRLHFEKIGGELVDLLPPVVGDVRFGQFIGREDEWLDFLQVGKVLFRERDALKRRRRRVGHLVVAPAGGAEDDVARHAIFAVRLAAGVDGLNDESLRVSVVVAFALEFGLAFSETMDDLIDRNGRRFGGNGGGGLIRRRGFWWRLLCGKRGRKKQESGKYE